MKALIILASGFEEIEAITVIDILRRADIQVDICTLDNINVRGAHSISITTEKCISDINTDDYDAVILPGGLPGATNLRDNSLVVEVVKDIFRSDNLVASICAAPIVLEECEISNEIDGTCYPGFEKYINFKNYVDKPVVKSGNVITAMGPAFSMNFALEIVEYLLSKEDRLLLEKDLLLKH